MHYSDPFEIMAATMPLLAVIGFIVVVIIRTILAGRHKELELKARITALEHNIPVEPLPAPEPARTGNLMSALGVIFVCTGLGLCCALMLTHSHHAAVWGIMPISAGLGLVIAARLNPKQHRHHAEGDK